MATVDLKQNTKKIKIGILFLHLIFFSLFLISHFLVWGFVINPTSFPIIPEPFTALEMNSGLHSIISVNGLFLCGFTNYILFFIWKEMRKYYLLIWVINNIIIISCSAISINGIVGVHLDWQWVYLDQLVFGFYLWLASIIIVIGLLLYINLKFIKRSNF